MSSDNKSVKIIMGADGFGATLMEAIDQHLAEKRPSYQLEVLPVGKYYEVAAEVANKVATNQVVQPTCGLLCCGTGMGMAIIANKHPSIFAAVAENIKAAQDSRTINNANVLCLGGMVTPPDDAIPIVEKWLASNFTEGWDSTIQSFLKQSMHDIPKLIDSSLQPKSCCVQHALAQQQAIYHGSNQLQEFSPVPGLPGAEWCCFRNGPALRAMVRFKAGATEAPHHHTHGHDVVICSGAKNVTNHSTGKSYKLTSGQYLYTPASEVHSVVYLEDTTFFISTDGPFDMFWDKQ